MNLDIIKSEICKLGSTEPRKSWLVMGENSTIFDKKCKKGKNQKIRGHDGPLCSSGRQLDSFVEFMKTLSFLTTLYRDDTDSLLVCLSTLGETGALVLKKK